MYEDENRARFESLRRRGRKGHKVLIWSPAFHSKNTSGTYCLCAGVLDGSITQLDPGISDVDPSRALHVW